MAASSEFSVGLAHELIITACKAGFEPNDMAALAHSEEKLRQILAFIRGHAEVRLVEHIVDCDADPLIPDGWAVEDHKKGGQLKPDMVKVRLHLSERQKDGKYIEGLKLRQELEDQPVLNANVLDYLLDHTELIPEDWKGKFVFFWGTIYRGSGGGLFVRYLYWSGGEWDWDCRWLGRYWGGQLTAAVSAS